MRRRQLFAAVEPPQVLVVEGDPEAADLLVRTAGCEAVAVVDRALLWRRRWLFSRTRSCLISTCRNATAISWRPTPGAIWC